ncbi:hypothetical protein HNR39_002706 [Glaciimonas immobilis]|uniref:Zinc/iron-chelating domain-containing protein n=1 Tax=Glaciimonas immobilis TaxID=728004 RepID=A0A840RW14_9BURK|nr:YkgJ family cysteine cluster protein [Glaciimonas immobilis]MBB5200864.1 hypothetical protein [Glaciimonas immobilis]
MGLIANLSHSHQSPLVAVAGAASLEIAASCRPGCGACCTAPSISSKIPGMPSGKPAGVRCVQLDDENKCLIFGAPERPLVCGSLQPSAEMCGSSQKDAMHYLDRLEELTG